MNVSCTWTTVNKKGKNVSWLLIIRVVLLLAIIFEVGQNFRLPYSTETSVDHGDNILQTHLDLHNVGVDEIAFFMDRNDIRGGQGRTLRGKKRIRNFGDRWRKKVLYTTKGVIVEGESNEIVTQRMEGASELSLLRNNTPHIDTGGLIEMSRRHIEPTANVSVAICFKTLFGDIDLGIVLQWAAYNRLLGFDHIFMWYRPEMVNNTRFGELQSLPYVTLTLNTGGRRNNYYNQWLTEETCNRDDNFAGKYDYALHADIDEYLWFPTRVGIKEFLLQNSELNYFSFGKRMYTLDHSSEIEESLQNYVIDMSESSEFSVSKYPFYIESFCYRVSPATRGEPFCPTWKGRAKVIVRPKQYIKIDTHGNLPRPNRTKGERHFLPEEAHFMEWPEIFALHNVTKRPPVDFDVQTEEQVHIHNLARAFRSDQNKNFRMQHDEKLKDWFHFVTSRFSTDA
jgi:hypothetical protein